MIMMRPATAKRTPATTILTLCRPRRQELGGDQPDAGDQDEEERNLGEAIARVAVDGEKEGHGWVFSTRFRRVRNTLSELSVNVGQLAPARAPSRHPGWPRHPTLRQDAQRPPSVGDDGSAWPKPPLCILIDDMTEMPDLESEPTWLELL